jgi:hypothetical protein
VFANESGLDFTRTIGVDLALAANFFGVMVEQFVMRMARGRSPVRARGKRRRNEQESAKDEDLAGPERNHEGGTSKCLVWRPNVQVIV